MSSRASRWQRFLEGKTRPQQFVLAVGALAGALAAVGGVVAGAVSLLDGARDRPRSGTGAEVAGRATQVRHCTGAADTFVEKVFEAARQQRAVTLNDTIVDPALGVVTLRYHCDRGPGSTARFGESGGSATRSGGGLTFTGCWSVTKTGSLDEEYLYFDMNFQASGAC